MCRLTFADRVVTAGCGVSSLKRGHLFGATRDAFTVGIQLGLHSGKLVNVCGTVT